MQFKSDPDHKKSSFSASDLTDKRLSAQREAKTLRAREDGFQAGTRAVWKWFEYKTCTANRSEREKSCSKKKKKEGNKTNTARASRVGAAGTQANVTRG